MNIIPKILTILLIVINICGFCYFTSILIRRHHEKNSQRIKIRKRIRTYRLHMNLLLYSLFQVNSLYIIIRMINGITYQFSFGPIWWIIIIEILVISFLLINMLLRYHKFVKRLTWLFLP